MANILDKAVQNLGVDTRDSKTTTGLEQYADGGKSQSYSDKQLEGFDSIHSYVNSCIRAIADQISSTPINLYKDGDKISEHNALSILKDPADHINGAEFKESIVKHLLLTGDSFIETVTTEKDFGQDRTGKRPVQLLPVIPPSNLTIVPTGEDYDGIDIIKGYIYQSTKGQDIALDKDEIIHTKLFNSTDALYGLSPLQALREELFTDLQAIEYNKSFFKNSARPEGILNTEQQLTDDAVDDIRQRWNKAHQGPQNANKVAVLSRALKYQSIGLSQADMQFVEQRDMTKEDIRSIFRTPDSILGDTQATYASSLAANSNFYLNVVMPLAKRIAESLTNNFLKEYWPRQNLKYEFNFLGSEALIPLIQEKATLHLQLIKAGLPLNYISQLLWNEKFFDNELGSMSFLPSSLIPAGSVSSAMQAPQESAADLSASGLIDHDGEDLEVDEEKRDELMSQFIEAAQDSPNIGAEDLLKGTDKGILQRAREESN